MSMFGVGVWPFLPRVELKNTIYFSIDLVSRVEFQMEEDKRNDSLVKTSWKRMSGESPIFGSGTLYIICQLNRR